MAEQVGGPQELDCPQGCAHSFRQRVCRECRQIEGLADGVIAATKRQRLMASLEDLLVVVGVAVFLVAGIGTLWRDSPGIYGMVSSLWAYAAALPLGAAVSSATVLLQHRCSLGKAGRGMRVVHYSDGTTPSLRLIVMREFFYKGLMTTAGLALGLNVLLLGDMRFAPLSALAVMDFLIVMATFDGRTFGDRILRTRVVVIANEVRPSFRERLAMSWRESRRLRNASTDSDRQCEEDPVADGGGRPGDDASVRAAGRR